MKRIGLLGGMSWESSIEYERIINEEVRRRLGGTHSADLLIRSYDFAEIEALQMRGAWDEAGALLGGDAAALERAGAELVVLCTNTMHCVAPQIQAAITVPMLHIAETTAQAVQAESIQHVGLLGTRFTMEQPFYREHLAGNGIRTSVPPPEARDVVHRIIYEELVRGIISEESRKALLDVIDDLVTGGAEGIVSGCTELELLVPPTSLDLPYFPTTELHAKAAAAVALEG